MDRVTLDKLIQVLRDQLELSRIRAASLDNDADLRARIAERTHAIQLLIDFLERRQTMAIVWEQRSAEMLKVGEGSQSTRSHSPQTWYSRFPRRS